MGEIEYKEYTGQTLDKIVAQYAVQTPTLIQKSFSSMNTRQGIYPSQGIEAFAKSYAVQIKEGKQSLPFPAKYSVYAYDIDTNELVAAGFLVDGVLVPQPDAPKPEDMFQQQVQTATVFGIYVHPDYQNELIEHNILERILQYSRKNNITTVKAIAANFKPILGFFNSKEFEPQREVELRVEQQPLKLQELQRVLSQ